MTGRGLTYLDRERVTLEAEESLTEPNAGDQIQVGNKGNGKDMV